MDDLISRQAAIDALDNQIKQCCKALGSFSLSDVDKHAVEVEMASLRAYRGMLEYLPTVQPEIIRCKDCKYWREDHTCKEHSLVSPMLANDFCSRAERRTDERMDDLISRQAAIDAMAELQGRASSKGELTGISKAWKRIKQLPSIQPEPHEGEWVDGRCNKCGGHAPFWAMASTYYKSDFCPHCGAKMKGAEHETN